MGKYLSSLSGSCKAYAINYGVMRNVKPDTWSMAMNDPEWIRFLTARHPLARLYSGLNKQMSITNKINITQSNY